MHVRIRFSLFGKGNVGILGCLDEGGVLGLGNIERLTLGTIVTAIILTIVFLIAIVPIGLVMRLFGRDPMQRKWDPEATTYWVQREPVTDPARYFRQF